MAISYPLTRIGLAASLNRLKSRDTSPEAVLKDPEMIFYHRNRNYFNNKYGKNDSEGLAISYLKQTHTLSYVDDRDRVWEEVVVGTKYHRPSEGYAKEVKDRVLDKAKDFLSISGSRTIPYCRKFISKDEHMLKVGYDGGAEFELIIRNEMRDTTSGFMETYNFGLTSGLSSLTILSLNGLHGKFDINTHKADSSYVTSHYASTGIKIYDLFK